MTNLLEIGSTGRSILSTPRLLALDRGRLGRRLLAVGPPGLLGGLLLHLGGHGHPPLVPLPPLLLELGPVAALLVVAQQVGRRASVVAPRTPEGRGNRFMKFIVLQANLIISNMM